MRHPRLGLRRQGVGFNDVIPRVAASNPKPYMMMFKFSVRPFGRPG